MPTPKTCPTGDDSGAVILYSPATINFWRTGVILEFFLVEHKKYNVVEVISRTSTRSLDASRIYMSTQMLFSKFTKEIVDTHVAMRKAEFLMMKKYHKFTIEPPECETREKVLQDLAVQYIKARLLVPLDGPLEVCLKTLPGDAVDSEGQPDQICEKPEELVKYEMHEAIDKTTRRSKKSWASSLRAIDPDWATQNFPEGLGRGGVGSPPSEVSVPSIEELEIERLRDERKKHWKTIFRRFILIMEITNTKRRLETISIGNALTCDAVSAHFDPQTLGKNSRRYSKIFEKIASGPSLTDYESITRTSMTESGSLDTLHCLFTTMCDVTPSQEYPGSLKLSPLPSQSPSRSPSRRLTILSHGDSSPQGDSSPLKMSGSHTNLEKSHSKRGSIVPLNHPVPLNQPDMQRGFEGKISPKRLVRRSTYSVTPSFSEGERSPKNSLKPIVIVKAKKDEFDQKSLSLDSREFSQKKAKYTVKPGASLSNSSLEKSVENCSVKANSSANSSVKLEQKKLSAMDISLRDSIGKSPSMSNKELGKDLGSCKESRGIPLSGKEGMSSTDRQTDRPMSRDVSSRNSSRRSSTSQISDSQYRRRKAPLTETPRAKLLIDHLRGNLSFTILMGALTNIRESFHISERNSSVEKSERKEQSKERSTLRKIKECEKLIDTGGDTVLTEATGEAGEILSSVDLEVISSCLDLDTKSAFDWDSPPQILQETYEEIANVLGGPNVVAAT